MLKVVFTFQDIHLNDVDYEFEYSITEDVRLSYIIENFSRSIYDYNGKAMGFNMSCTEREAQIILDFVHWIDAEEQLDDLIDNDSSFLINYFKEEAYQEFKETEAYNPSFAGTSFMDKKV